jgi:putative ABC transport system permease protein
VLERPGATGEVGDRPAQPPNTPPRKTPPPFFLRYLYREIRHRKRQALLVALGLAVGVGLVITVTAASSGVSSAQAAVLRSLYGIGTDIVVTKPPAATSRSGAGSGPPQSQAGFLSIGDTGLMGSSSVSSVARLPDVAKAAGGLVLTDIEQSPGSFPSTVSVDGVDLASPRLGPFASATISAGRGLRASDTSSDVAVVDSAYANANRLGVGSTVPIAGRAFSVVGLIHQPQGGGAADMYIPLARAQALTSYENLQSLAGQVNVIYVAASSSSAVSSVKAEIAKTLPGVTVTTSADLAQTVTGSLASAAKLVNDLGRWLAAVTLIAAVAVASLLSMGAVARRGREIGTLRALGWPARRLVAQILGESLLTGVAGAMLGVALGLAGAGIVNAAAPKLAATVDQSNGSHSTVSVHLVAAVSFTVGVAAAVLALAGGLIAGGFGAWRATRLRPADAFQQVE